MGKRGPQPKPAALHKLAGTYRKDRHGGSVEAAVGLPLAPGWLDPVALSVWRRVLPLLVAQSCASEIDTELLGLFCHHFSVFLRSKELFDVAEPGGAEWKNLNDVICKASVHIEKGSRVFGLSPADRAGIKIEKPGPSVGDTARICESEN